MHLDDSYHELGLAPGSSDAEVKRLGAEFAEEETGHVAALDDWLARTPRPSATWDADPDPLPAGA